ncbi:MAG: hypothetical protein AB7O37_15475 [Vicinamibacteria bacterium]
MKRVPMLWVAWFSFALAWVLPVHKEGVTLPEGLPGWQAFRVAAGAVWPYEGVDYDSWWGGALGSLSAATNVVMLGSLGARRRRQAVRRALGIVALAAFVVNAQWLFLNTEWVDLRAGYYLWWLSFLAVGCALFRAAVAAPAASLRGAAQQGG